MVAVADMRDRKQNKNASVECAMYSTYSKVSIRMWPLDLAVFIDWCLINVYSLPYDQGNS